LWMAASGTGVPGVSGCPSRTERSGRRRLRGTGIGTGRSTLDCEGWGGEFCG